MSDPQRVVIVGGGLAGMAAALALADSGLSVRLLEAKRNLGGRAASFRDPETGQAIDYCQHVSMGCCTNLTDFCRRTGLDKSFEKFDTLHFLGPKGEHCTLNANKSLPAPLHLLPALWGLKYLSVRDRISIGTCLSRLAKSPANEPGLEATSMHAWLRQQKQSPAAIAGFWEVILVSALGEKIDRASVSAARKVFVDGFMASVEAYEMLVPKIPLGELYGEKLQAELAGKGINIQTGTGVRQVWLREEDGLFQVETMDGKVIETDIVLLATPWRQAGSLLAEDLRAKLPELQPVDKFRSSPITGIHLWFDQAITDLPHAVLVNRFSQWLFKPKFITAEQEQQDQPLHYYQVVISASHELAEMTKEEIIQRVRQDLEELLPRAKQAELVRYKTVTERHAVFSPEPGVNQNRPYQETRIKNLYLAGDWTQTGWPSTMEGAVRSGYLATERVLKNLGRPKKFVLEDLPRGRLARWVIKTAS